MDLFLIQHKLEQLIPIFKEHDINEEVLRTLTQDDLKEMGVNSVGLRKQFFLACQSNPATDQIIQNYN